jgi:kynurenine formamidase
MRIPAALLALVGVVAVGAELGSQQGARVPVTSQADMDRWKKEHSNWGRWGPEDQKGTLNLITPAKRVQAAGLIKEGFAVSLANDSSTTKEIDNPNPYEVRMTNVSAAASADRISISYHGLYNTHLDALGHHFIGGKLYNGFDQKQWVTMEEGAKKGSIHNAKTGIFTRGVLMDIPRLKGVPYLEPGTAIYVSDLEAWEKQAGIKVGSGDAIFIRTGRWARRAALGPWEIGKHDAGLDASVIPWLRQRDVALMGTESAVDVIPIPAANKITDTDDYRPVHNFVLVALGMNLFDNCHLEELARAAEQRKRWEFALTAAPLPIVNGTGSPINPMALF